jgi:hypothetical protein
VLIHTQFPCLVTQDTKQCAERRTAHELLKDKIINDELSLIDFELRSHLERTLDEAYYPLLSGKVLSERNKEQVVSRKFSEGGNKTEDTPISMVSQLWIWRFEHYVVSAHALRDKPMSALGILSDRVISAENSPNEISVDGQIGLAVTDCIEQFGRPQANGRFPPPLHIFEAGVAKILSDVLEYTSPSGIAKLEIEKEREFLNRISDIQGELVMIQDVLNQQKEVLEAILNDPPDDYVPPDKRAPESRTLSDREWDCVIGSKKTLEKYYKLTEKISADAARIEKNIQDELNLKRTFATMDEARTSLLLGIAVIGFTVITVIFAPLAFVTALFALPIDKLESNKIKITTASEEEGTDAFTTGYIGKWFGECE